MKINALALALTLGTWMAVGLLLLSIINQLTGLWTEGMAVISTFYLGYDSTLKGTVMGMFMGFVDFFIGGYLLAWLYNTFSKHL